MRIDKFLRNAGILPRRSRAQEACDEGLVQIDGKTAKSSSDVRIGQVVRIELGLQLREYEVLALPNVPVAKKKREDYAKLALQTHIETDEW